MPIHILIYCVRPAQCSNCKHLVMMSNFSFSHLIILSFLLVFQSHGTFAAPRDCFVNAIYSFGDSIANTGNLLREGLVGFFSTIGNYPYGETYKKPTGRCSDGLLMIDFFVLGFEMGTSWRRILFYIFVGGLWFFVRSWVKTIRSNSYKANERSMILCLILRQKKAATMVMPLTTTAILRRVVM